MFNRGSTHPDLFPEVEKLRGNRDGNLDVLQGRRWGAVIDPSGYVPRLVRASAEVLADAVEHYTFISSISVYGDVDSPVDENTPLRRLEDETVEEINGETYGGLKVLCERTAEEVMPGRVLNVRAGLIVGPHDPTDRFTYWPVRVARGSEVLAPGNPDQPTQFIDVRDLSDWIVRMAEARKPGIFNATGYPVSIKSVLDTCKAVTDSDAHFTWVSESFLLEQQVEPFTEIPLWLPQSSIGILQASIARAIADGLTFRPLTDTVRDTLEWYQTRAGDESTDKSGAIMRAGLSPERERELLEAWKARVSAGR
jgi:2'-hydroxyisoflavone reductase